MAESKPTADCKRKENIFDIAHDLDLLFPNGFEAETSMEKRELLELREERIQALMKTNGTLHKVWQA